MSTATTTAQQATVTTTVTTTTPTTTTATPTTSPAKPAAPTLSGGKLSGVAKNRVALSFDLAEGKNGALQAGAITVTSALRREAIKHKLLSAKVSIAATDAQGGHTALSCTIRKPS